MCKSVQLHIASFYSDDHITKNYHSVLDRLQSKQRSAVHSKTLMNLKLAVYAVYYTLIGLESMQCGRLREIEIVEVQTLLSTF